MMRKITEMDIANMDWIEAKQYGIKLLKEIKQLKEKNDLVLPEYAKIKLIHKNDKLENENAELKEKGVNLIKRSNELQKACDGMLNDLETKTNHPSIRLQVAMAAMQGILASYHENSSLDFTNDIISKASLEYADALIKAEKESNNG